MKISSNRGKFFINLYPPFLFNGIRVLNVSQDYLKLRVRVRRFLLNRNLQGSIFGGTIFSSVDPFYALMYWQALNHRGIKTEAWLKSAEIRYRKPAKERIYLNFSLTEEDISCAEIALKENGKFEANHTIYIINKAGEVIAEAQTLVHLKLREKPAGANF